MTAARKRRGAVTPKPGHAARLRWNKARRESVRRINRDQRAARYAELSEADVRELKARGAAYDAGGRP